MGGIGKGENPEQLFAMGYAGKILITFSLRRGIDVETRRLYSYMRFMVHRKVASLVPFSL